jgi:hypothetical protein
MQDLINPGVDFTPRLPDRVLTHLTNIVVRLGGKNSDGEDRWRFCYILLPENQTLPLQQRSLVIRAMSRHVRHSVGVTTLTPEKYRTSLSVRAFQSGHIVYRQELSPEDTTLQFSEIEGPVRSNIAVPIGGETGEPLGVLYVTSYETNAFSPKDCRVLRIMTRMIEELLTGYNARSQRIRDLLPALFTRYTDYKLYDIYGGRFYLFLRGFSLEKTKLRMFNLKNTSDLLALTSKSELINR